MKGSGWLGIVAIAIGTLLIWAGYNNVALTAAIGSVLSGQPLPSRTAADSPAADTKGGGQLGGDSPKQPGDARTPTNPLKDVANMPPGTTRGGSR